MKHFIPYIIAIAFLTGVSAQEKEMPPKGGEPKNFTLPKKEIVSFDNGLTLVMIPYGSIPKATIRFSIKTGNIDENENQVWLTDLLADLLEEGSTTKTNKQIADEMAGMGGNLNIGVGLHTSSISSSVLYEFAPQAISVMADVLKNPKFPESELGRLKDNMKRDLSVRLSRPQAQANRDFYASIYPNHPYGRVYPTDEMIDSYTVADIKSFYESHFGALRTTVYVAGNFNREAVREAVESALGDWKKGTEAQYNVAEPVTSNEIKIIDRPRCPPIYYLLWASYCRAFG
ncbi:insulinase family protein [Maribacter litopenaei]|uniref:Insulinase family protein n=1 Tax=Maribacter litopenaei TaxID=2976127 RepID=A0ABY5YB60_9FLAO|nr:pitrilysin family protein [Maribacter litopenaei]UWX56149.1 insulinase family protein [Maribacter litopenaei]